LDAFANIDAIRTGLLSGAFSATEWIQESLRQSKQINGQLNAFLDTGEEAAMARAGRLDQKIANNEAVGALAGVPVALKDNLVTDGQVTTAGSRILSHWTPVYDAHVVERLAQADAIFVGKTNLDEFAMGSSTENSAFGPSRNPWDTECMPGGSSGGSAVAVAAGMACIGLGSDTGGSIRQPASLCGVLGLKPTWGRVSRYGLIAFASSLDQIGPIGRCAKDLATTLGVIAGHDPRDSTSAQKSVPDYNQTLTAGVQGLRIGLPKEYFGEGLDSEVGQAVQVAIGDLEKAGATVVDVSLPHSEHCLAAYYLIAPAEASSNLSRFDGVRFGLREAGEDVHEMYKNTRGKGFGDEVTRRIMLGTYALSAGYYDAYYGTAQRVRTLIRQDFQQAFEQCDVLASPTSPVTAPRLGEKVGDPLAMYLMDVYTISANLAGVPGISIPCGLSGSRMPIGLQLMAPWFEEHTLLQVAHAFEQQRGWSKERPGVACE
jgi:aspartyl-tRNA(Asn)/glutamyl-tRNA(Gln) amidotransferase subunit A